MMMSFLQWRHAAYDDAAHLGVFDLSRCHDAVSECEPH